VLAADRPTTPLISPRSWSAYCQPVCNELLPTAVQRAGIKPPTSCQSPCNEPLVSLSRGVQRNRWLARHAIVAIVGDTVFSHAGVLGDWVHRVDTVNQTARCWLDGQASAPPPALTSDDSPVWTRAAGGADVDCAQVKAALAALQVQRMVVGHTVQDHGITSACDGALWRIDVGLARRYGGPIQVLELAPGAMPKVVTGARR